MDKTPVDITGFLSPYGQGFSKKLTTSAQRFPPSMRTGVFYFIKYSLLGLTAISENLSVA